MEGQSSTEFIMIVILLIGVLTVLSINSSLKTTELGLLNIEREANNVLREVGGKINTAYFEGYGFQTKAFIPDKLYGLEYTIDVSANFLIITTSYSSYTRSLLTNATGTFEYGSNLIVNNGTHILVNP